MDPRLPAEPNPLDAPPEPKPEDPNAEPAPYTQMQKIQDYFDEMPTKKKVLLFGSIFGVLLVAGLAIGIYIASNSNDKPSTKITQGAPLTPAENAAQVDPDVTGPRFPTSAGPSAKPQPTVVYGGRPQPTRTQPIPMPPIPPSVLGLTANAPATAPYRYQIWHESDEDTFGTVRIIDTKSNVSKDIGHATIASPGDSVYFTKDFSHMVFIGSIIEDAELNKISFYNIAQGKIVYQISIDTMRSALPTLNATADYGTLSRLAPSPDGTKIAFSYGVTAHVSQIHPETFIMVIDLPTSRISLLNVKGLFRSWKDNTTLIYELNTPQPTLAQYPGYQYPIFTENPNNITKETKINNILEIR